MSFVTTDVDGQVRGYKVERTNQSPSDITEYVEMITKCTDVGHGEIPSAQIMFESREGEIATGTTQLSQFDPIKITIEDDSKNKYVRHFIVDRISPQRNETGRHVIVDLFGRQRYMQKMYAPSWWYYASFRDVLTGLLAIYNENKRGGQPTAKWYTGDIEAIPAYTYGTFDFGMETTVHDAIQEVVRRLDLPVAAGGAGERYVVVEDYNKDDADSLILRILPRGDRNKPNKPELKNPMAFTREKDPEKGNLVVAIGQNGAGSYPSNVNRYRSYQEEYENIRVFATPNYYKNGVYVRRNGIVYQRTSGDATVASWNAGEWEAKTFKEFSNSLDYSPWTKGKEDAWKSMAADAAGSHWGPAYPDANMEIREITFDPDDASNTITAWRSWVDVKQSTALPSTADEGYRILYTGNSTTSDKFGKSRKNALMQYQSGEWIVFREPHQFDECCVMSEARIYQYNRQFSGNTPHHRRSTSNLGWRDISGTFHGNDAFHYPHTIQNVKGLIADGDGETDDNSAIEITYRHTFDNIFSAIALIISPLLSVVGSLYDYIVGNAAPTTEEQTKLTEKALYSNGWWATLFEAPFPRVSVGTASKGFLYKQTLLDLHNITRTPTGQRGYEKSDANELGSLDGISFLFKFDVKGITLRDLAGDVPFRCYINDIFGETWISDFNYRFQNETQAINIPFNSFSNYRARMPISFAPDNWVHRVINPELRHTGIWERFFIKRIGVYCLWPYDDQGRYDPYKWDNLVHNIIPTITDTDVTYTGTIDAFHFTKAPVAISTDTTASRHTMRAIAKYPNVSNVIQLERIASSDLQVDKHQEDLVEFRVDNLNDDILPCELQAEQMVRIKDKYVVNAIEEDDTDARDYIVEKITYSVGDRSHNSALVANVLARRQVATG